MIDTNNSAIHKRAAKRIVMDLVHAKENKAAVALSKQFGISSPVTSFIAVAEKSI